MNILKKNSKFPDFTNASKILEDSPNKKYMVLADSKC